ncbi:family 49 glycosyl hydrolase [Rathayibacter sp. VKM Ac-2835]|uniref:glucodextranase DOMON-like domain-containing protein n=1 Tax=Rathayibacter sp. VKM Ac-2835 TaxID=2739043 RepID=UPI001563411B|nr:glucodextranase DOMON-like domain-containing protein [Rathayibacter sp. VKM Ac-2835]NRG43005.1 family 49 glycosyl hydrolase [Rathayibacter sp. VKM Ac-2835]
MPATRLRHLAHAATAITTAALLATTALAPAHAESAPTATAAPVTIESPELTTWWHDNPEANAGTPVADDAVRESTYYDVQVATATAPDARNDSFTYMSIPRGGNEKIGYTEDDGAEFSSDADLTMSWSSFEYSADAWVDVTLTTGQTITSVDEVTIRPTDLELEKQLVSPTTIRVKVPYTPDGYRFSVEFDSQLYTAYNDLSGASGRLTTIAEGNRAVHTEPRNSMMVFAQPTPTGAERDRLIPTEASGSIHYPEPGLVDDLDTVTEEIIYFAPGTYYMGSDYRALLPASVKWIYLAPGAYVKGAFRFPDDTQPSYKVTGFGVLSGEQYVYESDTADGYQHNVKENCHVTCVKMLQFESSNAGQTLDLQGVTIADPPYHSFVVYAHEGDTEVGVSDFDMQVQNYQQVGSWYWQTDGIELYPSGEMKNTFFHANDDVLKLYHSDVSIENTVIWKNENGPVFQWGWTPRDIDGVTVADTDVIHNRMYWKDAKYNTCIFNSSSHYEDMGATDRADVATTIKNMRFTDTRVEGTTNCAIRDFALSNTENIDIDGFSIDGWNDLEVPSQASLLKRYTDTTGQKVSIGNETTDGNGLSLHNYTVGGTAILKAGDNWAADELGRLNFDADTWDSWNATSDDQPTGTAPTLTINGLPDGSTSPARDITLTGTSNASTVAVTVNGVRTTSPVVNGSFTVPVTLPDISNRVVITATAADGVMTVERRTIYALGTKIGAITDPSGDDNGPGTYTYPTDSAFNAGSFDLTDFEVYRDGDTIRFVTTTAGPINNPWGGNGMSTQRLNIYLRDKTSTATTPLLPGTNTSAEGAWKYAIVADGRYDESRYGSGLYGADLARAANAQLQVITPSKIVSSVPAAALEGIDLQSTGYQVSMFSDAEDGEGIGNVRPVYSADCWNGANCPSFVQGYRFGGGAGEWTDTSDARDTDVTDSNAIDIISGAAAQATVMNPASDVTVAPYVTLDTAQTAIDAAFSVTSKKVGNQQVMTVTAKNNGATPVTVSINTPIGTVKAGTLKAGASKTFTLKTGLKKIPSFTAKVTVTAPDGSTREYDVPYKATAK